MNNETIDQKFPEKGALDIKSSAVKFGIMGGLAGVIVSLILYFANLQFESWARWISTGVMVAAILAGIKSISDDNPGKIVPFGSLFRGGMLITLIIAAISITYFLVYMYVIETDFVEKVLETTRGQLEEKGMSEDQIDNALAMSKKFMSPGLMVTFSLVAMLIFGAIASVIGAAIFKKEK